MVKFFVYITLAIASVFLFSYLLYLQMTSDGAYVWLCAMLLIAASMTVICLPLCKVLALTNKEEVADFLEQAFEINEYPQLRQPQLQQVQPVQQPLLLPSLEAKFGWHEDCVTEMGKSNGSTEKKSEFH